MAHQPHEGWQTPAPGAGIWQAVVESSRDLVILVGADGRPFYLNPAVLQLLGYPPGELIDVDPIDFIHPDDKDDAATRIALATTEDRRHGAALVRVHHRDGSIRWIEAVASDRLTDPEVGAIIVNARDVTARIEAEERLAAERKVTEDRLAERAFEDPLTGLANRVALDLVLDEALRRSDQGQAALYVDIDHFKQVNDHHGHAAGDHMLCAVAQRLRSAVRPDDVVARLGGDEFVIAPSAGVSMAAAEALADRVHQVLADVAYEEDGQVVGTVSIGVAYAAPWEAVGPADLLYRADQAMYSAKRTGRGRTVRADSGT